VKGVGENAVAAILAARDEGGPFESIWDFCRRVDQAQVNKRALESLIRGGALDSTGASRLGMLEALPAAMGQAARRRLDLAAGQESLFGSIGGGEPAVVELDPPIAPAEMPRDELLAAEKESLGLYVSSHPLNDCRRQLARAVTCGLAELVDRADGEAVTVGGLIGMVKNIMTRRGEPMMFARLDDLEGSVEVVIVPAVLAEARELLVPDALVVMSGRVDQKGEGETKLVAQTVRAFVPEDGAEEERLKVRVPLARLSATPLNELQRLLADHSGDVPVVVEVETGDGPRRYRLGEQYCVNPRDNGLVAELKTLFGERCLA
jgi:DNA polymerase-3 subunit alpha